MNQLGDVRNSRVFGSWNSFVWRHRILHWHVVDRRNLLCAVSRCLVVCSWCKKGSSWYDSLPAPHLIPQCNVTVISCRSSFLFLFIFLKFVRNYIKPSITSWSNAIFAAFACLFSLYSGTPKVSYKTSYLKLLFVFRLLGNCSFSCLKILTEISIVRHSELQGKKLMEFHCKYIFKTTTHISIKFLPELRRVFIFRFYQRSAHVTHWGLNIGRQRCWESARFRSDSLRS